MRNWTEKEALKHLGGVLVNSKLKVIQTSGLSGLTACSARDYLVKQCGYIILDSETYEAKVKAAEEEEKKLKAEEKKAKAVENVQAVKAKQHADKKANKQRKNFNKAKQSQKKEAMNA